MEHVCDWKFSSRVIEDTTHRVTWEYWNGSGCRAEVSLSADTLNIDFPPKDNESNRRRTERVFAAMLQQYCQAHESEINRGALLKINENSVNLEVIKRDSKDA